MARRNRRARRIVNAIEQLEWRNVVNAYGPIKVLDDEQVQMMAEYLRPIELSDDELALDAISEVGPGGHHFGTAHTLQRYESVFYAPIISSRENFESWQEAGSKDYEQPPLDAAIDEALIDYVERRKQETR